MKMKWLGFLCVSVFFCTAAVAAKQPNFLILFVDDLGWNDVGCYGSSFYETPNIDRLASQGVRFTNAYSASPVCSPTRGALMTGRHPVRVNITDWIPGKVISNPMLKTPEDRFNLDLEEVTMAELLKEHGYQTFFAGKWHLGKEGWYPQDQGFDVNYGGDHMGQPKGGYYGPKNEVPLDPPLADGEYLTDRLVDESIRFLEKNGDKPFLLFQAFYTVHTPIEACLRHIDHYREKAAKLPPLSKEEHFIREGDGVTRQRQDDPAYGSMVHALDENVGRLLRKLDELKLSDNTVVIFTSDNGGLTTQFEPTSPTSLLPLRAGKGWCYEGGIRVPLIIRTPGLTHPGAESEQLSVSMDLFPTIMNLAGIEQNLAVDGMDLGKQLAGESAQERTLYWHYPHYHGSAWKPGSAMRSGDWKLIEFYETGTFELYNLAEDIGERNELSDRYPEKKKELMAQFEAWKKETGAAVPVAHPDYQSDRPVW